METNLYCYTRTGRTISEKTMEDGNNTNTKDDKHALASMVNCYDERSFKLTANGHDLEDSPYSTAGEARAEPAAPRRTSADVPHPDRIRKRINPLRIHLGKRPFVDNSQQYCGIVKKKRPSINKPIEPSILSRNNIPRVPKLIPKRLHNVMPTADNSANDSEHNKPVPRLVPKSQLAQFKKGKSEKGSQLKEYAQSLGLQPMVKFKCRKCCSMSFKTLAMLKEHQLVCRAQAKEPALSPEAAPNTEASSGGPSRVTRKVYLCSACGTYYENWNLFLHMREVHNRHICLFCLGMFSKAEKLSAHLTNKHNVQEYNYESKEDFFNVYNGTLYLMCCLCDEICSEKDDFFNHDCNNVKPKPVPVLVSKNAVKPNSVTKSKTNDVPLNGPSTPKESNKHATDNKSEKKEAVEDKLETVTSQSSKVLQNTNEPETVHSDTSFSSDNSTSSGKDTSKDTKDSGMELDSSSTKPTSPIESRKPSPDIQNDHHNGDDNSESSEESDSQIEERKSEYNSSFITLPTKPEEPICPPVEREKEGIKLKLSLNNANSPVIINSTVDPTVGQHSANKPPSRLRRPPKRYEKDTPPKRYEKETPHWREKDTLLQRYEKDSLAPLRYDKDAFVTQRHERDIPDSPFLPKTPSIKMTICDKADSPFVKTTIYENDQDNTLKSLLNNNLENTSNTPEYKPENAIKTTIYDNKLEDDNALNRVPKLTVRVPKELLDKDSSTDYSSDSDYGDKLTVDENKKEVEAPLVPNNNLEAETVSNDPEPPLENIKADVDPEIDEPIQVTDDVPADAETEPKTEPDNDVNVDVKVEEPAADQLPLIQLNLDRPLDKYPLKELLKVFLASTIFNCVYCNHVRKIAVNCEHLCLHMVEQHRFCATVDSITAEELLPETITAKVRAGAVELSTVYINMDSYDSVDNCEGVQFDHIFECFQCFFKTPVHKDLYLHNRKMHQRTILLCVMCKSNFYSYSELLCHLCPGTYDSEYEIKFRCCLCNVDSIPSSFRLMVHLRKIHHACNVCLEFCHSQSRLSNHVWKHKLHHLCYRCGIAYRNKPDITKHLFWKHGTESVMCKKCMQKKWPHVYHFCTPPTVFACDECNLQFTRAVYLKVHKRFHSGEFPHICTEEGCTEKFVSKKLLKKHADDHIKKLFTEDLNAEKPTADEQNPADSNDPIPVIDLVNDKPEEAGTSDIKPEPGSETLSKKSKKKKLKDKDAMLLDVNLPALNLSESDSSDESDSGGPPPAMAPTMLKDENTADEEKPDIKDPIIPTTDTIDSATDVAPGKVEEEAEPSEVKPEHEKVLEIYHNLQKYQAKAEKEKTPPLVPIRKHVCESDHDYCLVPNDLNGDEDMFSLDKKKNRKSPKKRRGDLSSSSSSSSDSDSSCSCGSNCSCSSSSGSSSSSSSDSDSSDESGNEKKKNKHIRKTLPNRRLSNGSNVDVMGMSETPILVPEKPEPPINETDLETDESETDEEFYDEHPQKLANKLHAEKRNQLLLLASVAPSDGGSMSGEPSRAATPVKEELQPKIESEIKEKPPSSKKKSKKKKKSKSSKKHGPIKVNIPKDVIAKSEMETPITPLIPNKMTISLKSNTVHIPEAPIPSPSVTPTTVKASTPSASASDSSKRASKRRRVPNKFYGYCEDDGNPQATTSALKPHLPPKLEWRKEDLPSPVTHKAKKEVPSTTLSHRMYNYPEPTHTHIRLTAPIPDPEPPRILMNSELDSSDSDSSEEGALEIFQPTAGYGFGSGSQGPAAGPAPAPAPTYLNSGTSSLPYAFQRPPVRQAREGESVYCYCRCPYDEVSEMIACDAEGCSIEWFHFECVGIMVPPKGKWYCPECRKNQSFSGYR